MKISTCHPGAPGPDFPDTPPLRSEGRTSSRWAACAQPCMTQTRARPARWLPGRSLGAKDAAGTEGVDSVRKPVRTMPAHDAVAQQSRARPGLRALERQHVSKAAALESLAARPLTPSRRVYPPRDAGSRAEALGPTQGWTGRLLSLGPSLSSLVPASPPIMWGFRASRAAPAAPPRLPGLRGSTGSFKTSSPHAGVRPAKTPGQQITLWKHLRPACPAKAFPNMRFHSQ